MTEQNAGLLRRAAKEMRETADAATQGPWIEGRPADALISCEDDRRSEEEHFYYGGRLICESIRRSDRAYVASWNPTVAPAVADLLDMCARVFPEKPEALALARAYLGETS